MVDENKLSDALMGITWPASRQNIWDKAKENSADEETMEALKGISDMQYENMDAVKAELGMGEGGGEEMGEGEDMGGMEEM